MGSLLCCSNRPQYDPASRKLSKKTILKNMPLTSIPEARYSRESSMIMTPEQARSVSSRLEETK